MSVSTNLDRYRLISKLGSGGMATVDLAEDTRLGRRVALKRMHGTVDVSGLARLRREALAGASLNHPNLVSVYDILTLEDGDLIIVMEYVQGETLRDRLAREGALDPPEALRVLTGVAAGLDAIHGAGIVHRDVKPSNILLGEDGAVKVADLGVAAVPDRTGITTSGSIIGSLSYMAPEQLEGGPATPAVDIYGLAAVAFETLSGVKARDAPNPVALAHAIATQPPPRLSDAWPEAPPVVTELLERAMSREPRDRPGSAAELVAGLKAGFDARATTARSPRLAPPPRRERVPPPPPPRELRRPAPAADEPRPRRWALAVAALGAVAAAVAVILLLNHESSPASKTAASGAQKRPHTSTTHSASASQTTRSRSASSTASSSAAAPVTSGSSTAGSTTPTSSTATNSSSTTTSSGGAAAPDSSSPANPVGAVESFYQLAAARQYPEAWALADPAFRAQLGGYRSFQSGQAHDRSITFNSAQVERQTATSSTVAVSTTSVQSDGTRHCRGTVDLVAGAPGKWLLHQIDINCS
ncbi:MAG TPA: serine/threonine-protein kinase [Solirubrobacteraceae bacterium]|nr:serine/threonine-protein kinase [Solirubrobacteraceae bacterium]